jgi:hypothetical protein
VGAASSIDLTGRTRLAARAGDLGDALFDREILPGRHDADGAATLSAMTTAAGGSVEVTATAAATLGALVGESSAETGASHTADGAATLSALLGTAAGTIEATATGAATLGALAGASGVTVTAEAAGAGTLGALVGASGAAIEATAGASQALAAIVGASTAAAEVAGASAATLGALVATGRGRSLFIVPDPLTTTAAGRAHAGTVEAEDRGAHARREVRTATPAAETRRSIAPAESLRRAA